MIVVVNYGMGNLNSIANMLKKIGYYATISSGTWDIEKAGKLILPGVGSFDAGMKNLHNLGVRSALEKRVIKDKTPVLGICLGMQLFTTGSEEGSREGLGWIDAETIRFKFGTNEKNLKIPHMGWNSVILKRQSPLFQGMYPDPRFYFVHSYHVVCNQEGDVLTSTPFGYDFISSVQHENIFGVQFHPEKSHKFGMRLLKNFIELC